MIGCFDQERNAAKEEKVRSAENLASLPVQELCSAPQMAILPPFGK